MPGTLRLLFERDRDRGTVIPGSAPDPRLEKRRASNRKSQQKARDQKEALIARLQEENELLKLRVHGSSSAWTSDTSGKTDDEVSRSWSQPLTASGSSHTDQSPTQSQQQSPIKRGPPVQQPVSVNLEACRQAFLAVLASVCDPHLNTIHAVCAKFSESRGAPSRYGDLHPPRPVDRPLNVGTSHLGSTHTHVSPSLNLDSTHYGSEAILHSDINDWSSYFTFPTTYLSPSDFIPSLGNEGVLSVPGLEPAHPVIDLELAAGDVWAEVICIVDISRTDVEDLAGRLTEKIRCYGFGPVLMREDVLRVCQAFPVFKPTLT